MKIAYLAPEIPALSATFVYNEILELEKQGFEISPFTVHKTTTTFEDVAITKLQNKVVTIYTQNKLKVLVSHFKQIIQSPKDYLSAFRLLFSDIIDVGIISRTALGLVFRFFYAAKLADFLIASKCEHIHVHFAHVPTDLAMYAAKIANISFSVTAHANDLFERAWLLKQKVFRAAFFATISEFNKDFLINKGAVAEKIFIVRCGVNAEQFTQRDNFISARPPKIGILGRLVEKKGVDTLIQAVADLKTQGIMVELFIAGSGELLNDLKVLVKELDLSENEVKFLGSIPHKKVAKFIKSLDMFVLPCKQDKTGDMDGIPVVLMEAMLLGVPVISTAVSGIPELVINQKTGLLVEAENKQQLSAAIKTLLENKTLTKQLELNAIEKVKIEFNLSKNVANLAHLFKQYVL